MKSKEQDASQPFQETSELVHQVQFFAPFGFQRIINTDPSDTIENKEVHDSDVDERPLLDVYPFEITPYNHSGCIKTLYNWPREPKPYEMELQLRLPSSMAEAESFPSVIIDSQGIKYRSRFVYNFSLDEEKEIQVITEDWQVLTENPAESGYTSVEIQSLQFTIFGIEEE